MTRRGDRLRSAAALGALLLLAFLTLGSGRLAPSLTVTPGSLTLGPVLPDQVASGSVLLINEGDSVLTLGDLTVGDPAFNIGSKAPIPAGTTIDPAETLTVDVSFRSFNVGTTGVNLTIPSDDPAAPEQTVALQGIVLPTPVLSVMPDSLEETLGSGVTTTRQLVVSNTGPANAVDLTWALSIVPVPGSGRRVGPLDGVNILWDRTRGQTSTTGWRTLVDSLEVLGATVTEIPPASGPIDSTLLSSYRMYWSVDASADWTPAEQSALAGWVTNGGGMLIMGDNLGSLPRFDGVLAGVGSVIRFSTANAATMVNTTKILSHPTTNGISTVYLGIGARTLNAPAPAERTVEDPAGLLVGATEGVGLGRIVAYSDELFDDVGVGFGTQNLQLGLQTVDWLVGGTWLTADSTSGTVAPGSSQAVTLTFDTAELGAGAYDLNVRFTSNDPGSPIVDVPVHLVIAGVPDIDVQPASLDLGSVPELVPQADSVFVHNLGDDTLNVTGAVTDGPYFVAAGPPFMVLPAESAAVVVTFTPDSLGAFSDTLRVASDDPDEPEFTVPLSGSGRVDCSLPCVAPSAYPKDANGAPDFLFPIDVEIDGNPTVIRSFGFTLEYDGGLIQFSDTVNAGDLTGGFVVSAQENQPGILTCGGFATSDSIPADTTGTVARLWFRVACDTCPVGTTSELILDDFTNDLAPLTACCGLFTLSACPKGTGDINSDGILTPQDALCALKIFLNGGVAPPDSQCDGNGSCEVEVADADCDDQVTPGDALAIQDAWLAGDAPEGCIGQGGRKPAPATLSWGAPRDEGEGVLVLPLTASGDVPRAFGLQLRADPDQWEWRGVRNGPRGGWQRLDSRAGADGRIRLAGLDPEGAGRRGAVAELRFRRRGGAAAEGPAGAAGLPGIRLEEAFDVRFEGPAAPGAAPVVAAPRGLIAVGPVPVTAALDVRFGVGRTAADVDLRIVDVSGRLVRQLVSGPRLPGEHRVAWDGRDAAGRRGAAGIYFVRLAVGEETWTRKIVLLR